jgi:hypothetical protein
VFTGTRKLCPTGFCIGVLFKAAQCAPLKYEFYLPKIPLPRPVHRVRFVTEFHRGRVVDKRLLPHA